MPTVAEEQGKPARRRRQGRGGETALEASMGRRLAAEAIGTGVLVFFGAGSLVAALRIGNGTLPYAGLGIVAVAFGLAIAVAIYAFGTTSGCHINPAVTAGLAATRRFPVDEVIPYWIAQLVGAFVGALLIGAVFGSDASAQRVGATVVGTGYTQGQAFVGEIIGTWLLVTAIMSLAVDKRAPGGWAGLMIGLSVTAAIMILGPVSGGSLNPARTFGPLLANSIFGGKSGWGDFWLYVVGPLIGGVLAAMSYDAIARPRAAEAAAEPAQGTQGDIEGRRAEGDETGRRLVVEGTQGPVEGRRTER
jgi:glycerol uptake facilitator protein